MRLKCPACRASFSLDILLVAALVEDEAREAILASLKMPNRFERVVLEYLGLFRPPKTALSFKRVASLLSELQPMIESASVSWKGVNYPAPQEYFERAMVEMTTTLRPTLDLPMGSHGFLISVISGYSKRAAATAERQDEAKRGGHTPVGVVAAHQPAVVPPPRAEASKQMPDSVRAALLKKPP